MLDVGHAGPAAVLPGASFEELKERLPDPAAYLLGEDLEGVILPNAGEEFYGIPPGKEYVFRAAPGFGYSASGFAPLFSFARGGLAEAWTGGCYPFNDAELEPFPFGYAELAPYYSEVARRIGITGMADDLARFLPLHDHLLEPLRLDLHSEVLLAAYERRRRALNEKLGWFLGRTRVATLSRPLGTRPPCDYLGRCLFGCPIDALYTPVQTLRECMAFDNFSYLPGMDVRLFRLDARKRVTSVVVAPTDGSATREFPVDRLVLAAGTLGSSAIVLRSVLAATGESVRLGGLMDNRQALLPFTNLRMLGREIESRSYQYHLLGFGIASSRPREYVHGQITTLTTALLHPVIQGLPLDLGTATRLTAAVRTSLGVVNVNFHDTRRPSNYLSLEGGGEAGGAANARLAIRYAPDEAEGERIRRGLRTVRRALLRLGCVVPPGMTHLRPMGASVHYAGTLPMTEKSGRWTSTPECRSREFENLWIVDGSTFPFLPAKNITFTLMANAVRVASLSF